MGMLFNFGDDIKKEAHRCHPSCPCDDCPNEELYGMDESALPDTFYQKIVVCVLGVHYFFGRIKNKFKKIEK